MEERRNGVCMCVCVSGLLTSELRLLMLWGAGHSGFLLNSFWRGPENIKQLPLPSPLSQLDVGVACCCKNAKKEGE